MKNTFYTVLILLSLLYCGCRDKKATNTTIGQDVTKIEETTTTEEQANDDIVKIAYNKRPNKHDNSYRIKSFAIGDHIFIYRYSYIIGNEAITVVDKQGKLIALAASDQQAVDFDYIKYLYDKDGNHIGFLQGWGDNYPENIETFNEPYEDCEHFDLLYYDVCIRKDDDSCNVRYLFRYDNEGILKSVYDPITGDVLNAPKGALIRWRIEEGSDFWRSDLHGGKYWLMFYVMPIKNGYFEGNDLVYDVYDGYKPYDYEGDY